MQVVKIEAKTILTKKIYFGCDGKGFLRSITIMFRLASSVRHDQIEVREREREEAGEKREKKYEDEMEQKERKKERF